MSYSQYNSYTNCPRSWYLSKVQNAEEKQAWYFCIGSAVHEAIELHLLDEAGPGGPDVEGIFYKHVEAAMKIEPDTSKWLHGGSEEEPLVEQLALERAIQCYEKALVFLDDIDVWEVEYDASGCLPGLSLPVKAFVDVIGEHNKYGPVIVDYKTGAQKPKNNFQLETYAALLMHNDHDETFCVEQFDVGLWGMLAPKASVARPVDLSQVSPAEVGAKYQAVYDKMQRKLYQTNAGFHCKFCYNQENCLLQSGPTKRARFYDKADIHGLPY